MAEINYPESNDGRTRVRELEDVPTAKTKAYLAKMAAVSKEQANDDRERIADLKRQLETERRARIWHVKESADTRKMASATVMVADKQLDQAERRQKISINRLRRLKAAQAELAQMRAQRNGALKRLDTAEAELRVAKRTVQEWEEKYKEAVETEGKKWEHAVTAWKTRYDDALERIHKLKFELAHAGGEMPEGE